MTFNVDTLKVTEGHKALAAYIKRETAKVVKPESIALVLTLQSEFRKDPERVAERERVAAAARERDVAKMEKALATAKALAAKLGVAVDLPEEQEHGTEVITLGKAVEPVADDDDGFEETEPEPVATVTSIADAKRKRAAAEAAKDVVVEDTSAIDVVQAEDGWETSEDSADEPEDF